MDELMMLSAVLEEIDGVTFETLEGRVAFQKRVYLVQAVGVPLGYDFSWNLYGPYSPQLAEDGRRLELAESTRHQSKPPFTEKATALFEHYRRVTSRPPETLTEGAWLELLASMHYLRSHSVGQDATAAQIMDRLKRLKPYLSDTGDALDEAWKRLDELLEHQVAAG